ncbi:MAG: hypothetical protein R6U96_18280 [Promethearchaeia archaeon]
MPSGVKPQISTNPGTQLFEIGSFLAFLAAIEQHFCAHIGLRPCPFPRTFFFDSI